MQLHVLTDPHDPVLDDYRSLTDTALRRVREPAGGLYIAESAKVIERALQAGHRPRSVLTQQKWTDAVAALVGDRDVPVYVVADDVAERLTGFAVHRGVMAAMHRPDPASVAEVLSMIDGSRPRIAILEGLTDHTNVGAIFRSAAALGVDAVLITPTCADPLYRRSVRVSMGAVFQVPWTRIESWPQEIDTLRAAGYAVAGMTLGEAAIALDDLVAESPERLALVFGTEGDGILPDTDRMLDRRVTIPMMGGVDSLNVAAASAVAFYATR
ncbi:TrmH family RNA methyltransferase [Microbacterium esteraromaticum]|uniref:TrmH family RNA methyltransferase n=1 Tax=Microbacterium esteraromaticum TaxID=57043 RepID=UPI00195EDFBD|nr:RNA methyltransferase [Microbacterium esteraromaticum]MBM7464470.1 tRNA G18 (ribose-2'-O)-methylase SpoU [Microbacterium esteraromaticum]